MNLTFLVFLLAAGAMAIFATIGYLQGTLGYHLVADPVRNAVVH